MNFINNNNTILKNNNYITKFLYSSDLDYKELVKLYLDDLKKNIMSYIRDNNININNVHYYYNPYKNKYTIQILINSTDNISMMHLYCMALIIKSYCYNIFSSNNISYSDHGIKYYTIKYNSLKDKYKIQ